jgi:hypothetical protein
MGWLIGIVALLLIATRESVLMAFSIKPGVFGTLKDIMNPALTAVQQVWYNNGLAAPTITSIEDGEHMPNSKHYTGEAFDIRLNDIAGAIHSELAREVQAVAGDAYDVLHEYHGTERDHLHIEFDPN